MCQFSPLKRECGVAAECFQGPGARPARLEWPDKALISPWRGRGGYFPPPPEETNMVFVAETKPPMLPARSAGPGPK